MKTSGMPQFDLDLNRVTYEYYITAKAAINFPWPHQTSGGWHYLSYWNRGTRQAKVTLAGIWGLGQRMHRIE